MDRTEDVLLQPPSIHDWLNLSEFQKGLWMIDEVEARWQKLSVEVSYLKYLEIYWGKMFRGSLQAAAANIAQSIGIATYIDVGYSQEHAGKLSDLVHSNIDYATQDRDYQELMRYSYIPG